MPPAGWSTLSRFLHAVRTGLAPWLVMAVMAIMSALGVVALAWHVLELPLLDEVGYGDSYVLYDVLHFQRTGLVYRDLSQAPYLAAQYSPLVYILFGLSNLVLGPANAFVGPRLLVLIAFAICVATAASLSRLLVQQRFAWLWSVGVVASILPLWDWLLQIRADFLGIACGLLAARLLLDDRRWTILAAGVCAGFALQFKITFVAAGVAGALWLAGRRQWRSLIVFSLAAAATSAGLYVLYWMREPGMFSQLFTLSPGVPELSGAVRLLRRAAFEPVLLLAIVGIPAVILRDPRWWLIALHAGVSAAVAALTAIQAGANINYYFEPFLAAVPFAVAGLFVLARQAREAPGVGLLLVALAAHFVLLPRAQLVYRDLRTTPSVSQRNEDFARIARVLSRYHLFSTVPRIALLDAAPPLMEPYLLSYLGRMERADASPILRAVRDRSVDAVITPPTRRSFRGIPLIDPQLGSAIAEQYGPHCELAGLLVHTPSDARPSTAGLMRELEAIGCEPVEDGVDVVP
jgi:hypothetical protein